jgi:hypothetical protein
MLLSTTNLDLGEKTVDFEFDLDSIAAAEAECLKSPSYSARRLYPLYRGYPNGSKQYYEMLSEKESFETEEHFPEVRVSIFDSFKIKEFKRNLEQIKNECKKEIGDILKSLTKKNPYF